MQNMLHKLFAKVESSTVMNLNSLQNEIEPVIEYLHNEALRQGETKGTDHGLLLSEIYGNLVIQRPLKYIPFF